MTISMSQGVAALPAASEAVQVTLVVPMLKVEESAGSHVTDGAELKWR